MSHPKARDVAVRLIQKSDIIINNFRVGQMEKWNLGWEDVQKINPRIIYITMSLQGTSGPHKSYMGFGVNLNALNNVINAVRKKKLVSIVAHKVTKTNNIHENENRKKKAYKSLVKAQILKRPLAAIARRAAKKRTAKK